MIKYYQKYLLIFLFVFFIISFTSMSSANESWSIPSAGPIWTDYNTHDPGITLLSLGIVLEIGNSGDDIVRDVEWTSNAYTENGRIVFGDGEHGRIPSINPGEEIEIPFRPLPILFADVYGWSPIGFGTIQLVASALTSTGDSAQVEKPAFLFGPLLILSD